MKIGTIQRDIALKQGGFGLHSESQNFREKRSVSMDTRGYSADYCGSFTGKESKAAVNVLKKGFGEKLLTSKWFNDFLKYTEEHNVSTSALIALVLAGILRPITTMALPGKKDKEDKIYASGHAMASGIIGFLASTALTSPLDGAIKKCFDASEKVADPSKLEKGESLEQLKKRSSKTLVKMFEDIKKLEKLGENALKKDKKELAALTKQKEAMNTLVKNMPDWIIAIPRSILTIALIPPILKYVFGLEKKKKPVDNNKIVETPKMDFIEKPVFQEIRGGVK